MEIYPRRSLYRYNVADLAMYAGDFSTAEGQARTALEISPDFVQAYIVLALSELAQGRMPQAEEIYQRVAKTSARGGSFASIGLADVAMYQGRVSDATSILEMGITTDLANKDYIFAAIKLVMLAEAQLLQGRNADAMASADRAVSQSKDGKVLLGASRIYLDVNQELKVRSAASVLSEQSQQDSQAYAKLIEGAVLRTRGQPGEAIESLQQAQKILDTWLGHFELGRAYLDKRLFAEAAAEFDVCLKRRGEATALFLDEMPSYHYLPPVYYYRGRAREGLKSPAAADDYKTFLAIKDNSDRTLLVDDARQRLGTR